MVEMKRGGAQLAEAVKRAYASGQDDYHLEPMVLVEDGVRCEPETYYLGEIWDKYARAALCQKDSLHYVIVMANSQNSYRNIPTIHMFAEQIEKLGCQKAYTMDGGKTGTISMNGMNLNPKTSGSRWVSDILYFATAIPYAEETPGPITP